MRRERGSISLPLLAVCLLLTACAQLILVGCIKEQEYNMSFMRNYQLRLLCGSMFRRQAQYDWPVGEYVWYKGILQPGNEQMTVTGKSSMSQDGLIKYFEVFARAANQASAVQQLRQLTLTLSDVQRSWGGKYVLACTRMQGAEYLQQEALYIQANREEVWPPQVDFLTGKCISNASTADVVQDGLSGRFYYCNSDNFVLPESKTIRGSSVVANVGHITLGAGSVLPERTAFISECGNIYVRQNVRLEKTLLIAAGDVVIETGCFVKGLVIANRIILRGASDFVADADVVAPFASAAFINSA